MLPVSGARIGTKIEIMDGALSGYQGTIHPNSQSGQHLDEEEEFVWVILHNPPAYPLKFAPMWFARDRLRKIDQ